MGMLLYLSTNSRIYIQFAVNQCDRFTHTMRKIHAEAINSIFIDLKVTHDKGFLFSLTNDLNIDCVVDEDIASLYNYEDDQYSVSVKSRSDYVILLRGCTLVWVSKI